MWPWGHLAVAYLPYSLFVRRRDGVPLDGPAAIALAFGSQFPDLVDKPLAWTFGVIPTGRTLTHSIFTALALVALTYVLARKVRRTRLAAAFGFGYLSHLVGDAVPSLVHGDVSAALFFLWPAIPPVVYPTEQSFLAHFTGVEPTPLFLVQVVLAVVTVLVWHADGRPGLSFLWSGLERVRSAV